MSPRPTPPVLLALSPGDLVPAAVPVFLERTRAALGAGLTGVLLREALLPDRAFLALACELRGLLDDAAEHPWLGVHDRAHLAGGAGADALHLGFRSLEPARVRALLDARAPTRTVAIGFSSHAADPPERWRGADYLFHGPVLDTPSKRGLVRPVGFDGLARFAAAAELPVWALGGLAPEHAGPALDAGAAGIAVLSGVLGAEDPRAAARAYAASVAAHAAPGGPAA